ncbi:hypothetical protein [Vibrio paucivorans]|uniref:Uncharacterized protein n=1 Tax=Vibrio paucivorans TaxID=2829489 RepID=A0A9X3HRA6_9VIBR|nr:hypothetical protein [Vibrio paucivorans]MCW8333282.1 hypothetical protein [Vibrio paucivorans]
MELRNSRGEIARMADNLTLKEISEMGFSIDLCDENFDPTEFWHVEAESKKDDMPE